MANLVAFDLFVLDKDEYQVVKIYALSIRGQSNYIKQIVQRVLKDEMHPSHNSRFLFLVV